MTEAPEYYTEQDVQPITHIEQGYRGLVKLMGVSETKVPGEFRDLSPQQQQIRLEEEAAYPRRPGQKSIVAMNLYPYGTATQVTVYPGHDSMSTSALAQVARLGDFFEQQPKIAQEMFDMVSAGFEFARANFKTGMTLAAENKGATRSNPNLPHIQFIHLPAGPVKYPVEMLLDKNFVQEHHGDPHLNGDMYGLTRRNSTGRLMALEVANELLRAAEQGNSHLTDNLELRNTQIYEGNALVPLKHPVERVLSGVGFKIEKQVNQIIDGVQNRHDVALPNRCAGLGFLLNHGPQSGVNDNGFLYYGLAVKIDGTKPNCGVVEFAVQPFEKGAMVRGLELANPLHTKLPGIDEAYSIGARAIGKAMIEHI